MDSQLSNYVKIQKDNLRYVVWHLGIRIGCCFFLLE